MPDFVWIVLLLIVVAVTALLVWQRVLNAPRLVHLSLPPYEIPDVIIVGGVVVENRGRSIAPNVKISVEFDQESYSKIHHLDVQTTEGYVVRGGGEQHSFVTLRVKEMSPHSKVVVYWAASHSVQPRISVSSYQPTGESWMDKARALFAPSKPA